MAEIASAPASPPMAPRLPNLSQTLPKLCLQGLVASPLGRLNHHSLSSRRNRHTMHPALPPPYSSVIWAAVAPPLYPLRLTDDTDVPPEGSCGGGGRSTARYGRICRVPSTPAQVPRTTSSPSLGKIS